MGKALIRVLVVDDFEPFRCLLVSMLQKHRELQVIGEVSDGLEAVQKAKELEPDLILLDIGLPTLNGIAAARQIRNVSPTSKILFVSQNHSPHVAEEALNGGAGGYVLKSDAPRELLPAIRAVLEGRRFVSSSLDDHGLKGRSDDQTGARILRDNAASLSTKQNVGSARRHEAAFCSDEASLLDGFTQFIGAALKAGNSVIVLATESHRDGLLPRFQAYGLDMGAAIRQGRYIALDAADALSTFIVNGLPDPVRFSRVVRDLVLTAAAAAQGVQPRVAACGECAPLLWAQGNREAAIRLEQLWDKAAKEYFLEILCGYPLASFQGELDTETYEQICAEHSAVHSH